MAPKNNNSELLAENFLFVKDQLTKAQRQNEQLLKNIEKLTDTLILLTKQAIIPRDEITPADNANSDLERKIPGLEGHLNSILGGESEDEIVDNEEPPLNGFPGNDIISKALEAHGK